MLVDKGGAVDCRRGGRVVVDEAMNELVEDCRSGEEVVPVVDCVAILAVEVTVVVSV